MYWKITAFFLLANLSAAAQFHQPVFPNLAGQELLDSLASAFHPVFSMPQAQSRDTLFAKIYNHDDSLTCVYSGYTIWLDPAQDPTQAAFQNGGANAINTEHTYPQSLGASGQAEGDMHHLYPSRMDVNAARGNSPFAEIPDNETEEWFYQNQKMSAPPASNIHRYSEKKADLFEPREDHKGNVARAMMYFYTMYKEQADLENSEFFESQRQTFCDWHFLDPVDELEWNRTWLIADYQQQPNPFVLDCTLAQRTYCQQFGQECTPSSNGQLEQTKPAFELAQNAPNPFRQNTTFRWRLDKACHVRLEIFNVLGEKTDAPVDEWQSPGWHELKWEKAEGMQAGLGFYRLVLLSENQVTVQKMVIW